MFGDFVGFNVREVFGGAFPVLGKEKALGVLRLGKDADPEVKEFVVRDLQMLVEPYMCARGDVDLWGFVWRRMAALPFGKIVGVVEGWTPPGEVRKISISCSKRR